MGAGVFFEDGSAAADVIFSLLKTTFRRLDDSRSCTIWPDGASRFALEEAVDDDFAVVAEWEVEVAVAEGFAVWRAPIAFWARRERGAFFTCGASEAFTALHVGKNK
jgi:hypothetical protein